MEVRQKGLAGSGRGNPKNFQLGLRFGKVVGVDQGQKTVDVALFDGSGTFYDCPVLAQNASTASGLSYLPQMHLDSEETASPMACHKRDVYAVIGFVDNNGVLPVVIGFVFPQLNQLSFPNVEGHENEKLERHEGDQYRRIFGDTVSELGGQDVPSEEEIRYADNSYFKAYQDSKALADLTDNDDAATQPFKVKKEERKGFYFQHSSGTAVLIDPDGQIKVSHNSGTWLSISPETSDVVREAVPLNTVDSAENPPTPPSGQTVQVHVKHSSGTRLTIEASGRVELYAVGEIKLESTSNIKAVAPRIDLN